MTVGSGKECHSWYIIEGKQAAEKRSKFCRHSRIDSLLTPVPTSRALGHHSVSGPASWCPVCSCFCFRHCSLAFREDALGFLRLLSSERLTCKVGTSGNSDFGRCYHSSTSKSGPLCPTICTVCFIMATCFPSRSLEYWYMPGRDCLWSAPNKNPGHGSFQRTSLIGNTLHMLLQCIGGDRGSVKPTLCDSTRRGPLEACAWIPPDFTPCAFSLYWFFLLSFCCNKSQPQVLIHAVSSRKWS